jgi:uncharacterized protein (DUF362 family)
MEPGVKIVRIDQYHTQRICSVLPDELFSIINPGDRVVLKPNWIRQSHIYQPDQWESIITHPAIITAVLLKVIDRLDGNGRISIMDGPETESSFDRILRRYPLEEWKRLTGTRGISLEIIDLRDDQWVTNGDVVIKRNKRPGDPRGKTEINLCDDKSEFYGHRKSKRGYYGADYNIAETNRAHNGRDNLYRVSRTVLEGDVFINLPKLKTHKKAGITNCLKNLVGINTYRNFLPHYTLGTPLERGDQFPGDTPGAKIEGALMAFIKQRMLKNVFLAKLFRPIKKLGKPVFGDTRDTVRSGSWYGNDTLWRTILDLNKILFYADPGGTMRDENPGERKKYIGIADGVIAGEGSGPKAPDPVSLGLIFCGDNPAAIDAVCARFMGFDPLKTPGIANAFKINHYPITGFSYEDITVRIDGETYPLKNLPGKYVTPFEPHFGWKGYIEYRL